MLTLTELSAERDSSRSLFRAANGSTAVTNAEGEVLVIAQACDIAGRTAKSSGLAQHVRDASLLSERVSGRCPSPRAPTSTKTYTTLWELAEVLRDHTSGEDGGSKDEALHCELTALNWLLRSFGLLDKCIEE